LVDKVVERWWDLVDGDGVVSKTEDAIKSTEGESQTGLLGSFSEELILDLEVTDGDDILGDESAQAARAVLDSEGGAVLAEGRGGRRLVLGVEEASDGVALG
jgi:hypothetical protein